MSLDIADNIWCEFQRLNREAGLDPQVMANSFLGGIVCELKKQVSLKSALGDAWDAKDWRYYPAAEFVAFDIAGAPKAELAADVIAPFVRHCETLGLDAAQVASSQLALLSNGIARKYLNQNPSFSL